MPSEGVNALYFFGVIYHYFVQGGGFWLQSLRWFFWKHIICKYSHGAKKGANKKYWAMGFYFGI